MREGQYFSVLIYIVMKLNFMEYRLLPCQAVKDERCARRQKKVGFLQNNFCMLVSASLPIMIVYLPGYARILRARFHRREFRLLPKHRSRIPLHAGSVRTQVCFCKPTIFSVRTVILCCAKLLYSETL